MLLSLRPLSIASLASFATVAVLSMSAHAAPLLQWEGDYVSADADFRAGEGDTALPWNANQRLDPTNDDYPGTGNGTIAGPAFYGAHEVDFNTSGVVMNQWQIDQLSSDDAFSFQLRRNSGTGDDTNDNAYGLFVLFKAADIDPAGINVDQITIDMTNEFGTANPVLRAIVWDANGDFYVSDSSQALTGNNAATLTVSDTDTFLTFDETDPATGVGTGTPGTISLDDVMGVGFYIGQTDAGDPSTGAANRAQFIVSSVTIEGTVVPEPGSLALLSLGLLAVGSRRRR